MVQGGSLKKFFIRLRGSLYNGEVYGQLAVFATLWSPDNYEWQLAVPFYGLRQSL